MQQDADDVTWTTETRTAKVLGSSNDIRFNEPGTEGYFFDGQHPDWEITIPSQAHGTRDWVHAPQVWIVLDRKAAADFVAVLIKQLAEEDRQTFGLGRIADIAQLDELTDGKVAWSTEP